MRRSSWVGCLAIVMAFSASAQDAPKDTAKATPKDTLPFHKGQWGAEFALGTTFASAGALYFRSPGSAWLLDASFFLDYGKTGVNSSDSLYYPYSSTSTYGSISLRGGVRSYHPMGPSTQFFTTFGGLVRYAGGTVRNGLDGNNWTGGAGVFAEIGANYMINAHIGLGATAGLNLTYNHAEQSSSNGPTQTNDYISLSGALLALRLGVYF